MQTFEIPEPFVRAWLFFLASPTFFTLQWKLWLFPMLLAYVDDVPVTFRIESFNLILKRIL